MKILITGAAGFIGFHLVSTLIGRGDNVVGIDNVNDYYDVFLKHARLSEHGINIADIEYGRGVESSKYSNYTFIKSDISDREGVIKLFKDGKFDAVCNLAAQAGVRYSITNPFAYVDSNINGFINILEAARHNPVRHLVYASSSSVYGLNERMPFSTSHNVDHPISLYAASKKANELMAHTYSHLYGIPLTGLRFFTVYGPWGRPDMAYFKFTKAILEKKAIDVYNFGDLKRDFTYIDDIVSAVTKVIDRPPHGNASWNGKAPDPSSGRAPYRIYNIGNDSPVKLLDFISEIERNLGREAVKNMLPMQDGDVYATWADVSGLSADFGFKPETPLSEGIKKFVQWYLEFYKIRL
ncbi:MAG TPA: NAD-dependent epimerase [Candidatus Wallbacteria bacterium]|nr:NAD-dependent epimerase [Candidatus Wallbacteria bacterium]